MANLVSDPPVRLRPENEGVQFTPFGVVPLGEAHIATGQMGSALPVAEPERRPPVVVHHAMERPEPASLPCDDRSGFDASPGGVIKAARARIKELRAFLRSAKKAEKELRELERLVAAAKKPLASVRDIRRSAG